MSTALVLGAGGLVGQAFHLGVLTALAETTGFDGRSADVLVGTSAGSLVAAGLAAGLSADELADEVLGRRTVTRSSARTPSRPAPRGAVLHMPATDVPAPKRGPLAPGALLSAARHPLATRPGALAASLLPAGKQSTDGIARGVRRVSPGHWPDRDLRICAVRARDARRVVFDGSGPEDVGTAVAASCAIPGYFRPVHSAGEVYVDGGAHSPSNADVVLPDRPDLVVVLSPMSGSGGGLRADTPVRLAVRGYLVAEVVRLRRAGCRVVVMQPGAGDLQVTGSDPMRRDRIADVLARAAASTRRRLELQPDLLATA